MPKIDAPTVAEHRARMQDRLVTAADEILQSGDADRLTASAVSAAAGIARNSIYRYVDSIEDLRALVVARHLPEWMAAVRKAADEAPDPAERVAAWVRANLRLASGTAHGWLMGAARSAPAPERTQKMDAAHGELRESILTACVEALDGDAARGRVAASVVFAVVDAGFRSLDRGADLAIVEAAAVGAASGALEGLR
ncbi:TetR/AcrR family transcriptional regulator [Planctomonas sp. JC2975]|uniref:TetR/AcrR family transcriptional regulator n=1 Tax=Planctomonas sp. JC2975 TaxID=2729626 RepID=UPI0014736160|nr:TetR/AcrR family transcriptional regulator [Planctomonas sp. JC2975]NNC11065.1 TetR/AcrR family transcriptional regulator [Planctomonas sp. JC2975]